jgi:CHAT domain-containing protein
VFAFLRAAALLAGASPATGLDIRPLEPGPVVERALESGATDEYTLSLSPGEFARIVVRQRGIDVILELRPPKGPVLRRNDTGSYALERISIAAPVAGTYRLSVKAAEEKGASGRYEIRMAERRQGTPSDRRRLEAEAMTSEGLEMRSPGDASAGRRSRARLDLAVAMWQELGDPREEAFALQAMAESERETGNLPRALELLRRALPLAVKSGDRELEAFILARSGLAQVLTGDPSGALASETRALSLAREEGNRMVEGESLRYSGLAAWMMGDYQRSLDWSKDAVEIARATKDGVEEVWAIFGIATAYHGLGDYRNSMRYYEQALPLFRTVGDSEGEMLTSNALGATYRWTGRPLQALEVLNPTLALARARGDRAAEANALDNLGEALNDLGRSEEALASIEPARSIWKAMGDRREVWTLHQLARAHAALGHTHEALRFGEEAVAFCRRIGDRRIEAEVLAVIARVELDAGNLDDARARAEESLAIGESLRANISTESLRSSFASASQGAYDVYVDALLRLDDAHPSQGYADRAFAASERGRAKALLEAIADARLDLSSALSDDLRQREVAVSEKLSKLQADAEAASGAKPEILETVADAEEEWERLVSEIRRANPRYAALRYPRPISAEKAKALLDPRTALVSYSISADWVIAFVVTTRSIRAFRLGVSPVALAQQIENYVGLIARDASDRWRGVGERLYESLVVPWRSTLGSEIQRLVVVPDGGLNSLPFEALTSRADGRALVDDYTISYAPSATVLFELTAAREPLADVSAVLVLANPAHAPAAVADTAGFDLSPLPYSDEEAATVFRVGGPNSLRLVGRNATESRVKMVARRRYGIAHFATHGLIDQEFPLRSALLLASDPSAGGDDGLLQAREIYGLGLKADMVVLSSCQTALGRVVAGEGVLSLAQAFLHGGARSVVASLWRVDDRRAAELMSRFYDRLSRGDGKAEALRRAKLDLLRESPGLAPRFWASFVLIGEPAEVIRLGRPGNLVPGALMAGVAAALLGAGVSYRRRRRRANAPRAET